MCEEWLYDYGDDVTAIFRTHEQAKGMCSRGMLLKCQWNADKLCCDLLKCEWNFLLSLRNYLNRSLALNQLCKNRVLITFSGGKTVFSSVVCIFYGYLNTIFHENWTFYDDPYFSYSVPEVFRGLFIEKLQQNVEWLINK